MLLTGLGVVTADRLDDSAAARSLAILTVVAGLLATLIAAGGQLLMLLGPSAAGPAPGRQVARRGAGVALLAGLLSMVAVVLAGATALLVIVPGGAAMATEPALVVQRGSLAGSTAVSAQVTFPDLPAGSTVDATITAVHPESVASVLARSSVRIGVDGPGVVQLAASANADDEVLINATAPGRRCEASLPSPASDGKAVTLKCVTT
ncbi:MAG TPA: hypothetical protein VFY17_11175 [Pilimelia sp.]|nr:hypothetical protein [Pilimelia sp.]